MPNGLRPVVMVLLSFALFHCARAPIRSPEQSMRMVDGVPLALTDDLAYADLSTAIIKNIERLKAFGDPQKTMKFGPFSISKDEYILALDKIVQAMKDDPTGKMLNELLHSEFVFLEVYGRDEWGEVFVTSYFEPLIEGSLRPTKRFTQPLYGPPEDLVLVKMEAFAESFPILENYFNDVIRRKSRDGLLRGRVLPAEKNGSIDDAPLPTVVPYWSREEIDASKSPLKKKAKVLAWVDPVDAFFLQIQGSGKVRLPNKKILRVGYAAQNGHPYTAIGKFLFDVIPAEKMSMQKIEGHLRTLPAEELRALLSQNASYVFFRLRESEPQTFFGTEVVEGRTIATDQKYFPKGALAFLEYEKPRFADETADEPVEFVKSSRFVLDHDTGGAIRGPGRVDLFWGTGAEAKKTSGVMRGAGRLYYLFPKAYIKR